MLFEHLDYDRDRRPVCDKRFTKKYFYKPREEVSIEGTELGNHTRKIQKKEVPYI